MTPDAAKRARLRAAIGRMRSARAKVDGIDVASDPDGAVTAFADLRDAVDEVLRTARGADL